MAKQGNPDINEHLKLLEEKYESMGQDMSSYLEGLLHANYLKYWEYIHLDVLLNLQTPKTSFPDENIFIIYHQITELYFKLTLQAIEQIIIHNTLEAWTTQLKRMNRYMDQLINSFDVMIEGMDKEQFLKFRMSLLPASGFQSAQYRLIEIFCTSAFNLVDTTKKSSLGMTPSLKECYDNFYWKAGGIEMATGKKTLTLQQFEEKYTELFIKRVKQYETKNLWVKYFELPKEDQANPELKKLMRAFDLRLEVMWPLSHYRSAVKYLHLSPEDIAATGGTNWQKYLPPRFQRISLFPTLWDETEKEDWGKHVKYTDKVD